MSFIRRHIVLATIAATLGLAGLSATQLRQRLHDGE